MTMTMVMISAMSKFLGVKELFLQLPVRTSMHMSDITLVKLARKHTVQALAIVTGMRITPRGCATPSRCGATPWREERATCAEERAICYEINIYRLTICKNLL